MPSSAQEVSKFFLGASAPLTVRSRGTLLSHLYSKRSLRQAFDRVRQNKSSKGGVDDVSVAAFAADAELKIGEIRERLRRGAYRFSPLRPVAIEKKAKAGYRPILIPTVEDRIVQRAILHQMSPHLAKHVKHRNSHAFRSDAGVKSAVYQLRDELLSGKRVVLVVDIREFFPSIDSDRLYSDLLGILPDASLEPLLKQLQHWEIQDLSTIPSYKKKCFPQAGKGVPQGSALSPLLSNFYLRDLDLESEARGLAAIRYADDIAIPCDSIGQAEDAYEWLDTRLRSMSLTIHPLGHRKSRICALETDAVPGIEYLGFFLMIKGNGVSIRPCQSAFANAKNEVEECFAVNTTETLAERYLRLSYFLNAWLGTYGHVCAIDEERARLLDCAQRGLSRLLVQRGLLAKDSGLTREQRQFLGIDSLFAQSEFRAALRHAVRAGRAIS